MEQTGRESSLREKGKERGEWKKHQHPPSVRKSILLPLFMLSLIETSLTLTYAFSLIILPKAACGEALILLGGNVSSLTLGDAYAYDQTEASILIVRNESNTTSCLQENMTNQLILEDERVVRIHTTPADLNHVCPFLPPGAYLLTLTRGRIGNGLNDEHDTIRIRKGDIIRTIPYTLSRRKNETLITYENLRVDENQSNTTPLLGSCDMLPLILAGWMNTTSGGENNTSRNKRGGDNPYSDDSNRTLNETNTESDDDVLTSSGNETTNQTVQNETRTNRSSSMRNETLGENQSEGGMNASSPEGVGGNETGEADENLTGGKETTITGGEVNGTGTNTSDDKHETLTPQEEALLTSFLENLTGICTPQSFRITRLEGWWNTTPFSLNVTINFTPCEKPACPLRVVMQPFQEGRIRFKILADGPYTYAWYHANGSLLAGWRESRSRRWKQYTPRLPDASAILTLRVKRLDCAHELTLHVGWTNPNPEEDKGVSCREDEEVDLSFKSVGRTRVDGTRRYLVACEDCELYACNATRITPGVHVFSRIPILIGVRDRVTRVVMKDMLRARETGEKGVHDMGEGNEKRVERMTGGSVDTRDTRMKSPLEENGKGKVEGKEGERGGTESGKPVQYDQTSLEGGEGGRRGSDPPQRGGSGMERNALSGVSILQHVHADDLKAWLGRSWQLILMGMLGIFLIIQQARSF